MKIYAVIPAAGSGLRAGTPVPKQFVKVYGKETLAYTLEIFQKNRYIDGIAVAVHPDYLALVRKIQKKYELSKITAIVEGGKERQDSVNAALASLSLNNNDLVAVHDAARPLLPQEVLRAAVETAREKGSALTAIKARDTLLKSSGGKHAYIGRSDVYYVQTPQIFRYGDLKEAMRLAYEQGFQGTDESSLMHNAGFPVHIVEGALINFKVTTKEDLRLFKKIVKPQL